MLKKFKKEEKVNHKNKQLSRKNIFASSFRYHTKKEGYPSLSSDINKLCEIPAQLEGRYK
jgi:hypothetical protein